MIARSTAVAVQPAAARLHHVVLTGKTGGPGTARGVGRTCEWSWLASASSVSIDLDDGTGTLTLAVAGPSGFIRWVDRNALAVDLPRGSALYQALSRPSRSPGITLSCCNPCCPDEFVRLQGVGSVGPASPNANLKHGDMVTFRMTTFDIYWSGDSAAPLPSTAKEAS